MRSECCETLWYVQGVLQMMTVCHCTICLQCIFEDSGSHLFILISIHTERKQSFKFIIKILSYEIIIQLYQQLQTKHRLTCVSLLRISMVLGWNISNPPVHFWCSHTLWWRCFPQRWMECCHWHPGPGWWLGRDSPYVGYLQVKT